MGHADLKETSENKIILHAQLGNSYLKPKNSLLKIASYLVMRAPTGMWKPWSKPSQSSWEALPWTLFQQIIFLHTLQPFYKNLWTFLVFIPLQRNFQTSKIFSECENTFWSISLDEDTIKTSLIHGRVCAKSRHPSAVATGINPQPAERTKQWQEPEIEALCTFRVKRERETSYTCEDSMVDLTVSG